MLRPFLYRCPISGQTVQGAVAGDAPDKEQYEAVECAACRRFHLVNLKTLKLLYDENKGLQSR